MEYISALELFSFNFPCFICWAHFICHSHNYFEENKVRKNPTITPVFLPSTMSSCFLFDWTKIFDESSSIRLEWWIFLFTTFRLLGFRTTQQKVLPKSNHKSNEYLLNYINLCEYGYYQIFFHFVFIHGSLKI